MILRLKERVKDIWPPLRLRSILFATLFLVAALPGFGAVFLRVYENTLVRQTEAELIAQGAALAASAAALWPGASPTIIDPRAFRPEPPRIDLNATPILPERPDPAPSRPAVTEAQAAAARLAPVMAATRRTTLASLELLDRQGRRAGGGSYLDLLEVRAALAGRSSTVIRRNGAYRQVYAFEWLSRAAAIRIHHARPVLVNGQVVGVVLLSRSARALFRGLYEDRGKIAVGIVVIFGLLIVLTGLLSRGIARPIEALGEATRGLATGRGVVLDPPRTAAVEIQQLYRDFARMADAIDHRSRYLRDFAHAVSHEFKTPLTGIRGALELLREHGADMDEAERARFLANADADAGRLSLLVTRLLDLARADMTAVSPDARAEPGPVLHAAADAVRGPALALELPSEDPAAVAVPVASLERAIAALFENAAQAGATRIAVTAAEQNGRVVLTFADDGPGIAPGDRGRVFEPFFTTKRMSGGSGLGLPIVRSLLSAAGGTIELTLDGPGARFRLHLPRADPNPSQARPTSGSFRVTNRAS